MGQATGPCPIQQPAQWASPVWIVMGRSCFLLPFSVPVPRAQLSTSGGSPISEIAAISIHTRTSLIHNNCPAQEGLTMALGNDILKRDVTTRFDESKSSRLAAIPISRDQDISYLETQAFEPLLNLDLVSTERKISNIQPSQNDPFLSESSC